MNRLRTAARQIAANNAVQPVSPLVALRKLLIQERRDRTRKNNPRIGWKRGELFEVLEAVLTGGDWRSEWGDVGYYIAQTWLWRLYAAVTPESIIERAVTKFEQRAARGKIPLKACWWCSWAV